MLRESQERRTGGLSPTPPRSPSGAPREQPGSPPAPAGARRGSPAPPTPSGAGGEREAAAIKIQARVRGRQTRRRSVQLREQQLRRQRPAGAGPRAAPAPVPAPAPALPAPAAAAELEAKAVVIQSRFRGNRARERARAARAAGGGPAAPTVGQRQAAKLDRGLPEVRTPDPAEVTPMRESQQLKALLLSSAKPSTAKAAAPGTATKAAAERRGGWEGSGVAIAQWEDFAFRQAGRSAPLIPMARNKTRDTVGYRVRVHAVKDLPKLKGRATSYEVQVKLTFFDKATRRFYGTTCSSIPIAPEDGSTGKRLTFDVGFDAYYHSKLFDPQCVAVVELVMLWRKDGVMTSEIVSGWSIISLTDGASSTASKLTAQICKGTARYLASDFVESPAMHEGASLDYSVEAYPAFLRCAPLLPEDTMVTYTDVIPGLGRFEMDGRQSAAVQGCISSMANPVLARAFNVRISKFCLTWPAEFYTVVTEQAGLSAPAAEAGAPVGPTSEFTLRFTAHNGRRFLGRSVLVNDTKVVNLGKSSVMEVDGDVDLENVLDDKLIAVVVELMYTGPKAVHGPRKVAGGGTLAKAVPVGWAAFMPFDRAPTGVEGTVREGVYELGIRSGPGQWVREMPLFDWKTCAGKKFQHLPPPPQAFFSLVQIGSSRRNVMHELGMSKETIEKAVRITSPRSPGRASPRPGPPAAEAAAAAAAEEPRVPGRDALVSRSLQQALSLPIPDIGDAEDIASVKENQKQLYQIASAMQAQLLKLTHVVENMQQGQAPPVPAPAPAPREPAAGEPAAPEVAGAGPLRDDQQPAGAGSGELFAGGVGPLAAGLPGPTRATRSRIKELLDAIPADVRSSLRGPPAPPPQKVNVVHEAMDVRVVNEVLIQFVTINRADGLNAPVDLRKVFFTLSFFDFAASTSAVADLLPEEGGACLIAAPAAQGAAGGLTLRFRVDDRVGGLVLSEADLQDRRLQFCQYLHDKQLRVDIWDGESLLQYGSAEVDLRPLLRQGRSHAELLEEVAIAEPAVSRRAGRAAALELALGAPRREQAGKGALVVRAINVGKQSGRPFDPRRAGVREGADQNTPPPGAPIVSKSLLHDKGLLGGYVNDSRAAKRVTEMDDAEFLEAVKDAERRKASALATSRVRGATLDSQVRQQIHDNIVHQREVNKEKIILEKLKSSISTRKAIAPAYGELFHFEHAFTNRADADRVYTLRVSDPELRPVADAAEWTALRRAKAKGSKGGAPAQVEKGLLDGDKLFMAAKETIAVPFKFQTFGMLAGGLAAPGAGGEGAKTVTVELLSEDGWPVAVLEVEVKLRPFTVDRTFRFHHGEQDVCKRRLPLGPAGPGRRAALRCSDPGVAAAVEEADGEAWAAVKCRCGAAPEVRQFYVLVYRDALMLEVAETWQVFVHALKRVDLAAMVGQTTRASVAVRGLDRTQSVRCFSSHPDELQVTPDRLKLVAGTLSELTLAFRPVVEGQLDVVVHVVDAAQNRLVHSLLVATEARAPEVSKTFELEIPAGNTKYNKITYKNPWAAERTFHLRSTLPWLVQVRPEVIRLGPGAARPLAVAFDALEAKPGVYEALLFFNNEEDRTEDCYRVRVSVLEL